MIARKSHDHAALTTIEFNRLGLGLSRRRVELFIDGFPQAPFERFWESEIESVERLHLGLGNKSLIDLFVLVRLRAAVISGSFEQAAVFASELIDRRAWKQCGQTETSLRTERRWCRLRCVEKGDLVTSDLDRSFDYVRDFASIALDDQVASFSMLREVAASLGWTEVQETAQEQLCLKIEEHERGTQNIDSLIERTLGDKLIQK